MNAQQTTSDQKVQAVELQLKTGDDVRVQLHINRLLFEVFIFIFKRLYVLPRKVIQRRVWTAHGRTPKRAGLRGNRNGAWKSVWRIFFQSPVLGVLEC